MARKKMILMDTQATYARLLDFIPSSEKELRKFIHQKIEEFSNPYKFNFKGYAELFELRATCIQTLNLLREHPLSDWDTLKSKNEEISVSTLTTLVRGGFIQTEEVDVPVVRTETRHLYSL
jgi:hypothetical protein